MIGKDFDSINFTLFGMDLADPTDFIFDIILGVLSLTFAYRAFKLNYQGEFLAAWQKFFLYFGLSIFLSAFGHLFYNYFHFYGKLPGWFFIPLSIYWIERAMISAHWNPKIIAKANKIYLIKLLLVFIAFLTVWMLVDVNAKPQLLFLPLAINTILGLLIGAGVFSYKFKSKISPSFKYIFYGIVAIFPSAFVFLLKINLHPYFTKNDFSHVLMIIGMSFFYYGFTKVMKEKHPFIKAK